MSTSAPGFTDSVNRWVLCKPVIAEEERKKSNANEYSLWDTNA